MSRMTSFLRSNVIGLIALFVALSGTAYAVSSGSVDSSKVHLRFGASASGVHTSNANCHTGEALVGGGAEVPHGQTGALSVSRPVKHAGNGSQGWIASSTGGGATAIAICVAP
jgi:hypothetical protein